MLAEAVTRAMRAELKACPEKSGAAATGVDMPVESLTRFLGEVLHAQDDEQAYLLVNPMRREPFAAHALQQAGCESIAIALPDFPFRQEQWPRLVRLRPFAVEILAASIELALSEQSDADLESVQGFAIGGWLRSAAPAERLVRHFARCMQQRDPGYKLRYFRLADRRVLEWMWPRFDALQRTQWLGPITNWWTLDRCGRLAAHTHDPSVPLEERAQAPFPRLSAQHWAHARDCIQVQQILSGWRGFAGTLPADYLSQAAHALSAARRLGLRESNEIVLMCAYQLQVHPQLCAHPLIIAAAGRARDQALPLREVLAGIPDPEGWDRIRRELVDGSAYRQAPSGGQPDASPGHSE